MFFEKRGLSEHSVLEQARGQVPVLRWCLLFGVARASWYRKQKKVSENATQTQKNIGIENDERSVQTQPAGCPNNNGPTTNTRSVKTQPVGCPNNKDLISNNGNGSSNSSSDGSGIMAGVRLVVVQTALAWPGWGHRKVCDLVNTDLEQQEQRPVSESTVKRMMGHEGLLLPAGYHAKSRSEYEQKNSRVRREVFQNPPQSRNCVWQTHVFNDRFGRWH